MHQYQGICYGTTSNSITHTHWRNFAVRILRLDGTHISAPFWKGARLASISSFVSSLIISKPKRSFIIIYVENILIDTMKFVPFKRSYILFPERELICDLVEHLEFIKSARWEALFDCSKFV
ncbi:unnamed protein product [Toxocara canis]|uniref:Uncharacterized protein n=1 Tax=Toxocara canis TaxID=6265 RepID=A0A3P7FK18_TOXCA|nr:unnamed protein product [Toxocara canis]